MVMGAVLLRVVVALLPADGVLAPEPLPLEPELDELPELLDPPATGAGAGAPPVAGAGAGAGAGVCPL